MCNVAALVPSIFSFWIQVDAVLNDLFFATPQNTTGFKEVAVVCHPRISAYAIGFITSSTVLQVSDIFITDDHSSYSLWCV